MRGKKNARQEHRRKTRKETIIFMAKGISKDEEEEMDQEEEGKEEKARREKKRWN